jgi:hypothetical protein
MEMEAGLEGKGDIVLSKISGINGQHGCETTAALITACACTKKRGDSEPRVCNST